MQTTAAKPLTPMQSAVLGYIADFRKQQPYSPTLQEIADAFEVSKVSIFEHVTNLEAKGWITRDKHQARSIRIIRGICPTCGRSE
jgi:SOS-response transcriptional repressor LexA